MTLKDPVPEGYKATIDPPDVTQFVAALEKLKLFMILLTKFANISTVLISSIS